jgi:adenosine deaminase
VNAHDPVRIPEDVVRRLPKTDLHVHLDGSLRPETVFELMTATGQEPPASTPADLARHLAVGDRSTTLLDYLSIFETTLSVLQTADALERVAYELAVDAAAENIRHLEVRYAPILHRREGLSLEEVMDAVLRGLRRAESEHPIHTGVIVCGIRHISPVASLTLAELAVAYKGRGVIAFDLAGAEEDNPAKKHIQSFYRVLNANLSCTVHAGEAFGPASIHQALHYCGAHRIGHGTRLEEDPDLLAYVNDHRIPLEMCLTSNVHTGAVARLDDHPFRRYLDLGLRVTLNTDNRLISDTTMTRELMIGIDRFGLTTTELRDVLINGFKSAFMPLAAKAALLREVAAEIDEILDAHVPRAPGGDRSLL